jgi:hypothetical protein
MFKKFINLAFLPIVIILLATASTFILLQQTIRLGANEEIGTLADNIIVAVEKNRAVLDNQPQDQLIDPTKQDLIFIQAYNEDGSIIFSTLGLDGDNQIKIPQGVLDNAKNNKNTVTWSPKKDIRLATVVRRFGGDKPGYIVTGRSLKNEEGKINKIGKVAGITALVSSVILGIICLGWSFLDKRKNSKSKPSSTLAKPQGFASVNNTLPDSEAKDFSPKWEKVVTEKPVAKGIKTSKPKSTSKKK